MMKATPIMDWLCNSRSESAPTLDEYDCSEPESPNNPSTFLVEELGMNEEELATFKKKLDFGKKGGKKRKVASEEDIGDYFESDSDQQGSPTYAVSGDNSSDGSEGNGVFYLLIDYFMHIMS